MKVVTLSYDDLTNICQKNAKFLSGKKYDAIIGIASGGIFFAEKLSVFMGRIPLGVISASRTTSSAKKSSLIKSALRFLPVFLLDTLRSVEHYIQTRNMTHVSRFVSMSDKDKSLILNSSSILLVDDAVDSGRSVQQCIDYIAQINDHIKIDVYACVVTDMERTSILPDYYDYSNVLIRFPWAADAKE